MDYDYHFPPETIEYLAGQFDSNVRDLEGALKDISLVANVRQLDTITVEVAAEAIRARKIDGPKLTLIPIVYHQLKARLDGGILALVHPFYLNGYVKQTH